jgi:signal transduction histidine kinase
MVAASLKIAPEFRKRKQLIIGGERKAHDVIVVGLDDAVVGAAIDVAAIETARGQLDREVAAFDRTLDKVASAVAIFGPDQRLAFFNGAYARLWQLDRTWLASSPTDGEILDRLRELSRLPAIVDYRVWKRRWVGVGQGGTPVEDWWHLPDGRMVHVIAEQRPDGGVTCLYDDATERLALESRFRTLIDVQKETLDSLKEGVALFGPDGRLKLFNSAFAGIWKLSRSALDEGPHIDKIVHQARVLFDDDRTWRTLSSLVTSFADEREALDGEMVRADGSVIDFATAPLPDGATLITFSDVTATRHYERALVERNEALIAADRLKNQFISHVSYELRTPLTNIIGFGELLADPRTGPLIEKQRDYLNDISTSSRTLLAVIDDILDLATIDAGALELKLAPAGIRGIIEASVLGVRELAAREGIEVKVDIAPDIRDFIADEARVRQVLFNLLSNAIGFSARGQTVTLTCRRDDGMINFSVEDQGAGIPAEQQPRVFERFVSRTQGSKHRGAGLGLSIVKSLVELHGGDAKLASQPGHGTLVTVRFPERSDDPPAARHALTVDQQLSRA